MAESYNVLALSTAGRDMTVSNLIFNMEGKVKERMVRKDHELDSRQIRKELVCRSYEKSHAIRHRAGEKRGQKDQMNPTLLERTNQQSVKECSLS